MYNYRQQSVQQNPRIGLRHYRSSSEEEKITEENKKKEILYKALHSKKDPILLYIRFCNNDNILESAAYLKFLDPLNIKSIKIKYSKQLFDLFLQNEFAGDDNDIETCNLIKDIILDMDNKVPIIFEHDLTNQEYFASNLRN